jgi:hypothetical protein
MPIQPEPSWTVAEVAAFLRRPVETLYAWRKRRYGPRAAHVGVTVRAESVKPVPVSI